MSKKGKMIARVRNPINILKKVIERGCISVISNFTMGPMREESNAARITNIFLFIFTFLLDRFLNLSVFMWIHE